MDKLEVAREAVIIYFEENISATRAIEKVKEKYLYTDQSIQGTNNEIINKSISYNRRIQKRI